ncbi:MAG: fumarylacetoacetate hydrolase family protein [Kurthia sp.]|nr:fumarylacetoacetate hydrolase family protein [Candidatus Kurthia equi]
MKFIRYQNENHIQAALVSDSNEVFPVPYDDYVEFYYVLKNEGLTAQQYLDTHNISPQSTPFDSLKLALPIESEEIWASGVTYLKSKEARNYEATLGEEKPAETYYDKVYDAERPEIFFKSTLRRLVGPKDILYIRNDSKWQIPEPELTLIIGQGEEIIGYTLGNDMSCRDIEGENPLYLPQAKIWKNSCSIGPAILLPESISNPYDIDITCKIYRGEELMFEGTAFVNQLKRKLDELVHYLVYENDILPGTALMTGTCIVPPNNFTLEKGDSIEISSERIGVLQNSITRN